MAIITLRQLLHRPAPGGPISANDPLPVRLYGPNGQPISQQTPLDVRDQQLRDFLGSVHDEESDALKVALTGQTVEDVNGALAVRTKQTALAYTTWHFNDQAEVVVSAGSSIRESQARLVNGFSTLAFILRLENPNSNTNHTVQVDALWLSVPAYQSSRRAVETLWDKPTGGNGVGTLSALGETSTKAEYVMLEIRNKDTIDHGYHISALLRV